MTMKNLKPTSDKYYKRSRHKKGWKEIKAKKVILDGFEKFDFFMHEDGTISEGYIGGKVMITRFAPEKVAVAGAVRNLKDVLKDRAEEIADFADGGMEECYQEALEELLEGMILEYGLSPRYEEDF